MNFLRMPWRACTAALASMVLVAPSFASPWRVTIDTMPLQGQVGYLAFDFVAGNPGTGNAALISGFSSDAGLGAATQTGDVAGSLSPGTLTLGGGNQFFSEWLQGISVFGGNIEFDLDLGVNVVSGGTPDQFSFFLLDEDQLPFATDDPSGAGALFFFDLAGGDTSPVVFSSNFARATIESVPAPMPEPTTLLLVLAALMPALWHATSGRRRIAPAAAPC